MTLIRPLVALLAGIGLLGMAGAAFASPIDFFATNGPASGATVDGFNGQAISTTSSSLLNIGGGTLDLENAGIVNGTTGNNAAPWAIGTNHADKSNYVSVYGGGTATFTLNPKGGGAEYIGLLWGSVDSYNTIVFETETAITNNKGKITGYAYTPIGNFTGSQIQAGANGDQGASGTLYANFTSSAPIYRVLFESSSNSFEFDKLAFDVNPVPLPAALPMFASVLLGMGGIAWRRGRRSNISA
jgi:hypothetical protein